MISRRDQGERNSKGGFTFSAVEGRVSHTETDRKLQDICDTLTKMKEEQRRVEGFFNNTKNGETLNGLVEDIRDAMMEYQVCLRDLSTTRLSDTRASLRCSKISTTRAVDSS